jgi:hypothetical protein
MWETAQLRISGAVTIKDAIGNAVVCDWKRGAYVIKDQGQSQYTPLSEMLQGCAHTFFEKELSNIPGIFIQRAEYLHLSPKSEEKKDQELFPAPLDPVPAYLKEIEAGKNIPDMVIVVAKSPSGNGTYRWRGDAWYYHHPYFFHLSYSHPTDFAEFNRQRISENWDQKQFVEAADEKANKKYGKLSDAFRNQYTKEIIEEAPLTNNDSEMSKFIRNRLIGLHRENFYKRVTL